MSGSAPTEQALPLRERKKLRMRRALTDTALRLFIKQGFQQTTLEQLVDETDVSMRTFFRYFSSKEAVAMAAEEELWEAVVGQAGELEIRGPALDALRHALIAGLKGLDEDWERRFIATRGLAARTPELGDYSTMATFRVQEGLGEVLEDKLGVDGREDVRLRLVCEFAMSAWRCGAKNWVRGLRGRSRSAATRATLVRHVEDAFDAIPASLTFGAADA